VVCVAPTGENERVCTDKKGGIKKESGNKALREQNDIEGKDELLVQGGGDRPLGAARTVVSTGEGGERHAKRSEGGVERLRTEGTTPANAVIRGRLNTAGPYKQGLRRESRRPIPPTISE